MQRLAAPLDAVETAFVDPAVLAELRALPKLGRPELLEQRSEGPIVFQRVRYAFVGNLSAAVRAVVDPDRLSWVEQSTLDRRTHHTHFDIVPDNYAHLLEAQGEVQLSGGGDAGTTVRRATGEVRVNVPFVGRKVEAAIISGMREHAEAEVEVLERWVGAAADG
jgi:hypothetical protein